MAVLGVLFKISLISYSFFYIADPNCQSVNSSVMCSGTKTDLTFQCYAISTCCTISDLNNTLQEVV